MNRRTLILGASALGVAAFAGGAFVLKQRRDAEAHPRHRDPGNEGDEKALPAGADVTQANEDGQRVEHRESRLAWDGRQQGYPAQAGFARFPPDQIVNWNKELGRDALALVRRML